MKRDRKNLMRRLRRSKTLCALDIGTTKICALIGHIDEEGRLDVQGIGSCESQGISRGDVIDIDRTVQAIQRAVQMAEDQAKIRVSEVLVGIAGDHIKSSNYEGQIPIPHSQRGVDESDRKRIVKEVKESVSIPADRELIHTVVQSYVVNGNNNVLNPLGLSTNQLGVRLHMVVASLAAVQNTTRCVRRAGFRVQQLALESLASSMSVLSTSEKEMGVALLDIGGGTTDLAVFKNGCIVASGEVGLGGNSITNDIQSVWKISFHDAENMKKKLGTAVPMTLDADEMIDLPSLHPGRKPVKKRRRELAMVIEARVEEIFTHAKDQIEQTFDLNNLHAGLVLTGGTSMLADIDQVAERVFGTRCRIGHPQGIRGMFGVLENSPIYSTGVGLLYYGFAEEPTAKGFWHEWLERLLMRRDQAYA